MCLKCSSLHMYFFFWLSIWKSCKIYFFSIFSNPVLLSLDFKTDEAIFLLISTDCWQVFCFRGTSNSNSRQLWIFFSTLKKWTNQFHYFSTQVFQYLDPLHFGIASRNWASSQNLTEIMEPGDRWTRSFLNFMDFGFHYQTPSLVCKKKRFTFKDVKIKTFCNDTERLTISKNVHNYHVKAQ